MAKVSIIEFQKADVGDTVSARRYGKSYKGVVTIKHPGSLVLKTRDNEVVVVDADRIIKCIKKK